MHNISLERLISHKMRLIWASYLYYGHSYSILWAWSIVMKWHFLQLQILINQKLKYFTYRSKNWNGNSPLWWVEPHQISLKSGVVKVVWFHTDWPRYHSWKTKLTCNMYLLNTYQWMQTMKCTYFYIYLGIVLTDL